MIQHKNDGILPEGIILSDLAEACINKEVLSTARRTDKWETISYETATISGTMLSAFELASPQPAKIKVNLSGWHKIYVSLMGNPQNNRSFLKLTGDKALSAFTTDYVDIHRVMWKWESFEESFWKCADLTGQDIEIVKRNGTCLVGSHVAWFRFVPMTEEEVQEWKAEDARTDTKRIFATTDMFSVHVFEAPVTLNDWLIRIENLKHSDVEILTLDRDQNFEHYVDPHSENASFLNEERKALSYLYPAHSKDATFTALINYAHEIGIKAYISRRMGLPNDAPFPYDQEAYGIPFSKEHPEYRCINRDGVPTDVLSFAYPEVQQYVIDQFVDFAKLDCDGITLIYTRGIPYVLFEKPVLDAFAQRYPGLDPRELPLADPRIQRVHCTIMTEFMRKLRFAMDGACIKLGRRKMAIHAYVGTSLSDNRMFGLDVETWARERLIDSISAYPLKIRERLEDVMQKSHPDRIDLAAYSKKQREGYHKILHRYVEYAQHIELEHVREYVALSKQYPVKVYFDLLREMSNEDCERLSAALCENGAERFSLWDIDSVSTIKSQWAASSRLGHLEDIRKGQLVKEPSTVYRILFIGGKNIGAYNPAWTL